MANLFPGSGNRGRPRREPTDRIVEGGGVPGYMRDPAPNRWTRGGRYGTAVTTAVALAGIGALAYHGAHENRLTNQVARELARQHYGAVRLSVAPQDQARFGRLAAHMQLTPEQASYLYRAAQAAKYADTTQASGNRHSTIPHERWALGTDVLETLHGNVRKDPDTRQYQVFPDFISLLETRARGLQGSQRERTAAAVSFLKALNRDTSEVARRILVQIGQANRGNVEREQVQKFKEQLDATRNKGGNLPPGASSARFAHVSRAALNAQLRQAAVSAVHARFGGRPFRIRGNLRG